MGVFVAVRLLKVCALLCCCCNLTPCDHFLINCVDFGVCTAEAKLAQHVLLLSLSVEYTHIVFAFVLKDDRSTNEGWIQSFALREKSFLSILIELFCTSVKFFFTWNSKVFVFNFTYVKKVFPIRWKEFYICRINFYFTYVKLFFT